MPYKGNVVYIRLLPGADAEFRGMKDRVDALDTDAAQIRQMAGLETKVNASTLDAANSFDQPLDLLEIDELAEVAIVMDEDERDAYQLESKRTARFDVPLN